MERYLRRRVLFKMVKVFKPLGKVGKTTETFIEKINFQYGLINYGTRIIKTEPLSSAGEVATIYTVPPGKVFYLISSCISALASTATDGTSAFLRIAGTNIMQVIVDRNTTLQLSRGSNADVAISYSVPLILKAGETIIGESELNCSGFVSVTGYEIDKALIPNFI